MIKVNSSFCSWCFLEYVSINDIDMKNVIALVPFFLTLFYVIYLFILGKLNSPGETESKICETPNLTI